ncbi:hypothetical protein FXO38_29093 [Capsicum annuum]|nr:hypothetical protein FXO38_29093 [Capsicum annuum]KAF3640169.1 hypothetical protein FXO37_23632 [Capsicum annuum]
MPTGKVKFLEAGLGKSPNPNSLRAVPGEPSRNSPTIFPSPRLAQEEPSSPNKDNQTEKAHHTSETPKPTTLKSLSDLRNFTPLSKEIKMKDCLDGAPNGELDVGNNGPIVLTVESSYASHSDLMGSGQSVDMALNASGLSKAKTSQLSPDSSHHPIYLEDCMTDPTIENNHRHL